MLCPYCNQFYDSGIDEFCPNCGEPIAKDSQVGSAATVGVGDYAAIEGGVHVDSHNTSNIDSHDITHIHQATQTEEQIRVERRDQFFALVNKAFEQGIVDQHVLAQLEAQRLKLGVSKEDADAIVAQVRRAAEMQTTTELDFMSTETLRQIKTAIETYNLTLLGSKMPALQSLANNNFNDEVQHYYNMLKVARNAQTYVTELKTNNIENYWRLFWGYVAFLKCGMISDAQSLLPAIGRFGYPQQNLALLFALTNLLEYRRHPEQDQFMIDAQENLMQAAEGLAFMLTPAWEGVKMAMIESPTDVPELRFYTDLLFKEFTFKTANEQVMNDQKQNSPTQMPVFDAQQVNLPQMQGFNALEAARKMGISQAPPSIDFNNN